ncbi:MAG: hypothetical protein Q8Q09_02005 [Deltaproteobacteria bacterium]|nr:hypothetical protein [Deltaproteobacteria bacterium]
MPRRLRPYVRCPRAREDDICALPPGVRHCLCDETADPVGQVLIHEGQLFWHVVGGKAKGWHSYLAVLRRGSSDVPIELEGAGPITPTTEGGRVQYRVRAKRDGAEFLVQASEFAYAASDGRETVKAEPVDTQR